MLAIACRISRRNLAPHRPMGYLLLVFGLSVCAGCSQSAPAGGVKPKVIRPAAQSTTNEAADQQTEQEGEDWPRFLGPRGTGVSGETGLLEKWPESGPPVIWGKRVGTGYSAPSIRGDRLVLHQRRGNEEVVECMRPSDGTQIWQFKYASNFSDPFGYNNGPRCSPLLTEDRCYTYGAEGTLLCTDLRTGRKIWMRDVKQDFQIYKKGSKVPNWFFGIGCTPILEGNLLITLVGGQPNSAVVAFDADTGKTVWQNVGKPTWDGIETGDSFQPKYRWTGEEILISYSSPFAATIHGKRHVLCLLRQGLISLNPQDGSVNFKYWFKSRKYESVNAARPLVIGDKIFISAAYQTGSALLQVGADGKSYKQLWRDRRNMQTHWSTPFHVDGYIYGFSGRHESEAMFRCIELETGKVVWETSGFEGDLSDLAQDSQTGRPYYGRGSKIRIGEKFIVLGERGTLALVKINPKKFEEIARTTYPQIHYPAWTAPVLSRKRLYLRGENALICLDLKRPKTASKSTSNGK